jgi:hypothetical protein
MSDHKKALQVQAKLTEQPKKVADIAAATGMETKAVYESLGWLEKHRKATIHFGQGWTK